MRISIDQLSINLKKSLEAVYLLTGDEPLQIAEAADEIRLAAKQAGYINREIISIDKGTEWQQLTEAGESLSIFSDYKLIDLRFPSAKPGLEGSKVLQQYCQHLPENTILLITAGKVETAATKSVWFQALDKAGIVIQIWPLQGEALVKWLQQRSQRRGIVIDTDALKMLTGRIEGNLLAAAQEVEKLYILHGQNRITKAMIESEVASNTRFDVFNLNDALLAGQLNRALHIVHDLKAEDTPMPVVIWAISREVRMLYLMKVKTVEGTSLDALFKRFNIWDNKRKLAVQSALGRLKDTDLQAILLLCVKTDKQAKGQLAGDSWESLWQICLQFVKTNVRAIE